MKKLTKSDKFNMVADVVAKAEISAEDKAVLIEFVEHELGLLAKKNRTATGDKKLTKTQEENASIKELILCCISDEPRTIAQIQAEDDSLSELSNQKMSALIRQLVASGEVIRTEEKRKAYFSLPVEEVQEEEQEVQE